MLRWLSLSSSLVAATELHEACARAELRHVVRILKAQPHLLDALDENGLTALMVAAQRGLDTITQFLLDAGAAINLRGFRQMTALHHAAVQRRGAVAVVLLERGANPNVQMDDGRTPLHYAAGCCPSLVSDLLARGANPNVATPRCTTPLHMALMGLVGNPQQTPPPALRDQLLQIVSELVEVGGHTELRMLTTPNGPPRGVSAREMIERSELLDSFLKARLHEVARQWPPAPPMPCTELARKVVYTSFRPKGTDDARSDGPKSASWWLGQLEGKESIALGLLALLLTLALLAARLFCGRRAKGAKARKSGHAAKGGKGGGTPKSGKGGARSSQRSRDRAAEPRPPSKAPPPSVGGCKLRRQPSSVARTRSDSSVSASGGSAWQGAQGGSGAVTTAANGGTDDEDDADDTLGEESAEHDGVWEGVGDRARAKNEERRLRREQQRWQEPFDPPTPNGTRRRGSNYTTPSKRPAAKGPGASGSTHGLPQDEETQVAMALSLSLCSDTSSPTMNGYPPSDLAGTTPRGARVNGYISPAGGTPGSSRRMSGIKPTAQRALTISDVEPRQKGESLTRGELPSVPGHAEAGSNKRPYSEAVQNGGKPHAIHALDEELCALIRALRSDKGLGKRVDGPLDLLELEQERYETGKIEREQFMRSVREVVGEEKLSRILRSLKHSRGNAKASAATERERRPSRQAD